MLIYITLEDLLYLHEEILKVSGGSFGVRDMNILDSAVHRPQATFGGEELYPDLFVKAAALCHSIIQNHGFVDGNKRTGMMAAITFLDMNGQTCHASLEDFEDFAVRIVVEKLSLEEISLWLRENCS